jgi:hypothetical protein
MDRTVVGVVTGFEQRQGGWRRYSISEPGRQWPVKADTKKPEIIAQVDAYMATQSSVAVSINEADSGNPNPHQPGKNFINRYLNAIALAAPGQVSDAPAVNATGATAAATAPILNGGAQQGTQMISYDADAREKARQLAIMRENAMGHVIGLVASGKVDGDSISMVAAAEVFVAYYVYGPSRFGVPAFSVGIETEADSPSHPAEAYVQQTMAEPVVCPECGGVNETHAEGCSNDIPF